MAKLSAHGMCIAQLEKIRPVDQDDPDDKTDNRTVLAFMSDRHILRKTGYKYVKPVPGWYPKGWEMTTWKLWKKLKPEASIQENVDKLIASGWKKIK